MKWLFSSPWRCLKSPQYCFDRINRCLSLKRKADFLSIKLRYFNTGHCPPGMDKWVIHTMQTTLFSLSLCKSKTTHYQNKIEPPHDKTSKMICAPSEDSDQPGHLSSLTWVFLLGHETFLSLWPKFSLPGALFIYTTHLIQVSLFLLVFVYCNKKIKRQWSGTDTVEFHVFLPQTIRERNTENQDGKK